MQNLGTKGDSSAVFWLLLLRTILHTFFHVTLILFSSFCLFCFLQLPCFLFFFSLLTQKESRMCLLPLDCLWQYIFF